MVRATIIIMLVAMAGILVFDGPDKKTVATASLNESHEKTQRYDSDTPATHNESPEITAFPKATLANAVDEEERLNNAVGLELRHALDNFWMQCELNDNCDNRLKILKPLLREKVYALLANYPQLKRQWQQILGDLNLAQFPNIEERVAIYKDQTLNLWGNIAEQLFADEFAQYDFKLESRSLNETKPEDYAANYQALVEKWQHQQKAFAIKSKTAKYEQAVSLIPDSYSEFEKQLVIEELSQKYLSKEEQFETAHRRQQIKQQEQQIRNYQEELNLLKTALEKQRQTTRSSMPEPAWQTYYQQQIVEFRKDFFMSETQ